MVPRPILYETSLPYPLGFVTFDFYQRPLDMRSNLRVLHPLLHIDPKGRVTDISCETPDDSAEVAEHRYVFMSLRFEPGRRNLEKTDMILPVAMIVGDTARAPVVTFPLDQYRRVHEGALYFDALARNGVVGPQLERFPSYFFKAPPVESNRYPFQLFRLDIDTAGRASNIVFVRGDSDTFTDQLTSATRFATFRPAYVDGIPRPARAFLLVSLLPQVNYPTDDWLATAPDTLPVVERVRLRLVADTVGLMQGPVPKKEWSGEIKETNRQGIVEGTISARMRVDTLGAGGAREHSCEDWKPIAVLGMRSFTNRFFPARTWSGDVVPFEGLVYMEYVDKSNVRIRFSWF